MHEVPVAIREGGKEMNHAEVPCHKKANEGNLCVHAFCRFVHYSRLSESARVEWEAEQKQEREQTIVINGVHVIVRTEKKEGKTA